MPPDDRLPVPTPVPANAVRLLRARSEPDGFVPFDRYMDVALYGAEVGYYARDRSPFGPRGDFYTAPQVHPIFARTLAARIAQVRAELGPERPFRVVDLGAGDGTLLAGIVRALGERGAVAGVEAVVTDRSPARRSAAAEAVSGVAPDGVVAVRSVGSVAELGPVRGVVLANELLDAQPVRRLAWDGSGWRELGFRLEGDRLLAAERPLHVPVPRPPLPSLGEDDAGTVLEVSPAAEAIVREVADHLAEGLLLVLDYGDEETALLRGHPRGTVAAVRAHLSVALPDAAPGEADLSAFVNFTRVRRAAASAGLVELAYRSQPMALASWGFPGELERALDGCSTDEERVRLHLAAKNLLFGFGTFRVLELAAAASAERLRRLSEASSTGPS